MCKHDLSHASASFHSWNYSMHVSTIVFSWSRPLSIPRVSEVLSRDRWEDIERSLHFSDNSDSISSSNPSTDKLRKIRPMVGKTLERVLHVYGTHVVHRWTNCLFQSKVFPQTVLTWKKHTSGAIKYLFWVGQMESSRTLKFTAVKPKLKQELQNLAWALTLFSASRNHPHDPP